MQKPIELNDRFTCSERVDRPSARFDFSLYLNTGIQASRARSRLNYLMNVGGRVVRCHPAKSQKVVDSAFVEWDKAAMPNEIQQIVSWSCDQDTGVETTRNALLPEALSGLLLSLSLLPSTNGDQ